MASSLNSLLLCFLILCLPCICVFAQTRTSNINVGNSFTAGDGNTPWVVSPSGDFAFGFQPHKNNSFFLLSIWYANIPNKTIVWYANGDSPAPKGSRVQITAAEGLKLTYPDGRIWTPENKPTGTVASGALNDSGNFVLRDGRSNSVWETFKNPKDTMLPSQTLEKGGKLSSRKSEADFAQGRFQLVLQDDGNLVMHSVNLPSEFANENYFYTGTVESNTSSPGIRLVFNESSGDFYVKRENNDTYAFSNQIIPPPSQFYLRATLNFDGVLTFYQHPKSSSGTWTPIWSKPDNICSATIKEGTGICGYNSICRLGDNSRPNCTCPPDYSLLDPDDPNGSCKPDFVQGCKEDELSQGNDLYDFEVLTDIDWPLSDYALLRPFTEDQCRRACMEDCFCAVAIFRAGDSCWKKRWPLSNGKYDTSLNRGKALIKVRKDNSSLIGPPGRPPIIERKNRDTLILVVSILLGSSAFLNLILIGTSCLGFFSIQQLQKKLKNVYRSDSAVETNLRCFTYKELEEATNGFKEELGRGAFAVVYKGTIYMGSSVPVAVKRLNNFLFQETVEEFKNEVNVIGRTHHKNLVRLLGFCEEGTERILVYEYMSNGTLASLLFSDSKPNWNLRLKLAFGIARGLVYLHEDCGTQIIHCDIKPQNILLDDYFNARISDFGLSKLLNMNQSRTHTAIRGTKGYVALEWFKNMPITAKVDVYSFGVLLLEIVCCRRSVDNEPENEERAILTDWAYDCYATGSLEALVEEDEEALDEKKNLEKLVMIAIWCIQEDPTLRPTMRKVSQMLEGVAEVPAPPCQILNSVTLDPYISTHFG